MTRHYEYTSILHIVILQVEFLFISFKFQLHSKFKLSLGNTISHVFIIVNNILDKYKFNMFYSGHTIYDCQYYKS